METALRTVNALISALFFICYAYQFLYIPLVLAKKQRPLPCPPSPHRYAVLIAARNEAAVIGGLLDSLRQQTYNPALLTVFVVADNCTDGTADIARRRGAVVYERFNHINVGKGYALDFLTQHIKADYPDGFDGYFVFDADNVLSPDYIERMNAVFSGGYEIVTSYRNSKNYADNWISAGYALWFLRESRYLNGARMRLGTSAAVGGTGFLFSQRILDKTNGWQFYLLTEDIEFSVRHITDGEIIAICRGRGALRRAAHGFPPVLPAAAALGQGLHPGVPEVRRQAAEGRSFRGSLELLRYGHGHHARLRPRRASASWPT